MSSNNPQIQNLNLINSEVFINEFKIIKETNSIIKNNISKHFKNCLYIDDLFYILDFQLLFINQINQFFITFYWKIYFFISGSKNLINTHKWFDYIFSLRNP